MKVQEDELIFEIDDDFSQSVIVNDKQVFSLCVISEKKLIAPLNYREGLLLIIQDWKPVHEIKMSYSLALNQHSPLPGFEINSFPFIIDYGTGWDGRKKSDTLWIVNLKTGHRDVLVKECPQHWGKFPATFFRDHGNGRFDLHFCVTRKTVEGTFEHTWQYMEFKSDFAKILK